MTWKTVFLSIMNLIVIPAYPGCPGQTAVKWLLYEFDCYGCCVACALCVVDRAPKKKLQHLPALLLFLCRGKTAVVGEVLQMTMLYNAVLYNTIGGQFSLSCLVENEPGLLVLKLIALICYQMQAAKALVFCCLLVGHCLSVSLSKHE